MDRRVVMAFALLTGCAPLADAKDRVVESNGQRLRVTTVASGLDNPWGLAFLPDGRLLVTERPGRLRIVERSGALSPPVPGLPAIYARGQGGLLDVALDPDFPRNRLVYLSFSEPGEGGTAGTAVLRGRLDPEGLTETAVIFRQTPKVRGGLHFGSRLVFARDGTLFVTLGERYDHRDRAQDLSTTLGKLVRIRPDGSIPPDNPFLGRPGVRPEIYSLGHRNVQGGTLDPRDGSLVTIEHGAMGGDEINRPRPGLNYGWPVITYGLDYSGETIGIGTQKDGMEQPVHYWDPSIAPSGAAFYRGERIPAWRGSLFTGSLKFPYAVRIVFSADGTKVEREENVLEAVDERYRDVRDGPDGFLYLLTRNDDAQILRVGAAD